MTSLLLASASPARAATLRAAGIEPIIRVADLDEAAVLADVTAGASHSVATAAAILAEAKAHAVNHAFPGLADVVLGCDSILEFEGESLGKPHTADVAAARWRRMRGRTGILHTGHCVIAPGSTIAPSTTTPGGATTPATSTVTPGRLEQFPQRLEVASTEVTFADISDAEIDAYVATGEPLEVAGAFTIDGLGGAFVTRISGDHHNVVGLSLPLVRRMLLELGIAWPSLWNIRP